MCECSYSVVGEVGRVQPGVQIHLQTKNNLLSSEKIKPRLTDKRSKAHSANIIKIPSDSSDHILDA